MGIRFQEVSSDDPVALAYIMKWDNDEAIKHLLRPNFKAEPLCDVTVADVKESLTRSDTKHTYMIFEDEQPIGYVSLDLAFEHLVNKDEKTGWVSVCIGEKSARNKGIGKQALAFLEFKCQEFELTRIELGVFSFNARAHALYKRKGYQEIATLEKKFYYAGQWHDDIRLEKRLHH